jgi:Putative collagen-binding domain of a collagenase
MHDVLKLTLWGNLMAGGAGVEFYFGYSLADNDLTLENFRSRDKTWDYSRIATEFFRTERIPFWDMANADLLVGNSTNDNGRYCFARELYLVYLPSGGSTDLDLREVTGQFTISWFDPRNGGALKRGSVASITGGKKAGLGACTSSTPSGICWGSRRLSWRTPIA